MIRNRILTEEEGWKSWLFEDHVILRRMEDMKPMIPSTTEFHKITQTSRPRW